nr:MAG TPA: Minor structural protein putative tail fiber [Caudoviricetes sp.]
MKIKRGNTVLCDAYLKNNSFTVDEIMGEQTLTLNFLSRDVIDFEVGDYVECEGERYKIRYKEKVTKREKSLGWEYNIPFYSSKYDLEDVVFFLNGKPEYKKNFDSYTGTARQILELIVKNMNREDSGWKVGSCIESRPITISFKDKSVGNVLDDTVKQIDTEYWISQKTVSIGKRKYDSNGLVLGQGEGLGFTELEVSSVDEERPTTVIYPYGSDKNLGPDYGADYLMLPGGLKEMSKNTDKYGRLGQKKIQFDHIFPKGEFLVTTKIDDLTLQASGIDFNLKDCLLDEVEAIVTFQDGGLAGYDLAIVKESVDDKVKQFKLKENKEENALTVPGDINFAVGDKFILTGIKMPQVYIDNASNQLAEEAQTWLDEHCEKRIQLRGKCDEVLFRQMNLFIACGQMVGVYSDQLKIDREIRVTKVKRYIENDDKPAYRYELTLSDFLQGNGFKDLVNDVDKFPDEIEDKVKPVREWTKRSWRDVMETLGMMFDPEGDYFTELIKPLAVHTAQLIVGTNSQQMDLIGVKFIPNADNDPNYFKNTAGKLVHFTVSETVREWSIPAASFRLSNSLAYYVYAKCPKDGSTGSIFVSERQIKLEAEAGYYHFWIGVLNTPEDNIRSWNPNYGYTEIAGQSITTGIIKDKLARLVIDLINARIIAQNGATISGKILFSEGSSGLDNVAEWPAAKQDITNAKDSANQANKSVSNLGNYVDGAFADGIIEESEAKAIEKYINTVKTDKSAVEATYNKLYVNTYLTGTAKSGLLNSKVTLFGAIDNLLSAINSAIADGRTTVAEKNNVDSKFSLFNSAMSSFNTAVETANKAIQDKLKEYADNASGVPDSFKNEMAQRLGYADYAALEAAADASNTIIKNGKINTTLIEATAIITSQLIADAIKAKTLDVNGNFLVDTEGKATMVEGAIGPWRVTSKGLTAKFTEWNNNPKMAMVNESDYTKASKNFMMGLSLSMYTKNAKDSFSSVFPGSVPGNGSCRYTAYSRVHNLFSDCESNSDKKTTMVIESMGATKGNTALALIGALQVTGGITSLENIGREFFLSEGGPKYRRVVFTKANQTVYLPSTDDILAYFGKLPEATGEGEIQGWGPYHGIDNSWFTFELFRVPWTTGALTVRGSAAGNGDYSSISGTPIYSGKDQYTYGQFTLNLGEYAIVSLINRQWYVLYKGKGW